MDEAAPLGPAPRRSRVGPVTLFVVLALVVGLALMWLSIRDGAGWWKRTPETAAASNGTAPPATLPAAPPIGATDPVALANRESALAAQIAALETRAALVGTDVAAAADRAGRAEAILVAFAARRSIERGTPLGYLEDQLRQRFGATQPRAVETVIQAGRDPVTIEALRQALDVNGPLLLNPGAESWFAGLIDELRNLIVLHDANTPSPLPSDRLARARRMLDFGQVEPAVEEIGRLPGGPQAVNWTAAAQRYIAARRALDTLETAAIVGTIPTAALPATESSPATPAASPADPTAVAQDPIQTR